jgi:hypothetical protein
MLERKIDESKESLIPYITKVVTPINILTELRVSYTTARQWGKPLASREILSHLFGISHERSIY